MEERYIVGDVTGAANSIFADTQYNIPVDISEIAGYLGIEYFEDVLPYRINGLYQADKDGGVICVNVHPLKTGFVRRFAGAHEIGHHILIKELGIRQVFLLTCTSSRCPQNACEVMCDLFARCLLVPETSLLRQLESITDTQALSDIYNVTSSTIRHRLNDLGIHA